MVRHKISSLSKHFWEGSELARGMKKTQQSQAPTGEMWGHLLVSAVFVMSQGNHLGSGILPFFLGKDLVLKPRDGSKQGLEIGVMSS